MIVLIGGILEIQSFMAVHQILDRPILHDLSVRGDLSDHRSPDKPIDVQLPWFKGRD
jgi:hypothetical protein